MKAASYLSAPTPFGDIGLVWVPEEKTPSIVRIFLPEEKLKMKDVIRLYFPGAVKRSHEIIEKISLEIQEYLSGVPVVFSLANFDFSACSKFQQKVLLQNMRIPRGFVTTYGRLADELSLPKGARAVGNALAGNPFPLMIPCHRVVRVNGMPGGYGGGGPGMKIALLEMEGVMFGAGGRVRPECFR
ncbi:MAG: MGMT family protein [Syntrophales bacterium]|nr:MGMT family protein [Syntrophales bacterium]